MKYFNTKKFNWLLLFSFIIISISCEKENNLDSEEINEYTAVNQWIKSNMDVLYYWNSMMPTNKNMAISPADYFESILYKAEDRFSYITDDYNTLTEHLGGVQMEAGYDFTLFRADATTQDVLGVINYIKPKSPASSVGLVRGDIFLTVNGKQITLNNYMDLLNETSANHTLGIYRDNAIKSFSLSVVKYEENPILLDTIYDINGTKIAYLIYNFFTIDKGDYSYTYLKQLNEIFGNYKQANVKELILDLRYNSGGQVMVSTSLASMISNRSSSDVYCIDQYNSIVDRELKKELGDDYNKTFFDNYLRILDSKGNIVDQSIPVNKLGLNRVYVLVSHNTASASELLINGLKPYADVVLVGETTYGKNVGMWLLHEEEIIKQKVNGWAILPVVFKSFNSDNKSDFNNGFIPNIEADEYSVMPLMPLGNIDEILLEAALVDIGVKNKSALRSSNRGFESKPLMSSIDRMPERRNIIR